MNSPIKAKRRPVPPLPTDTKKGLFSQGMAILRAPNTNTRALVISEPFWGTVTSWYNLYGPLYMVALGVTKTQVGLVLAAGLIVQVFAALLGGHLSDHWGRKRTMQIADAVGWVAASAIWFAARSTVHFVLAGAINGLYHAAVPAWGCLLVEDTRPEDRQPIYAMVQMMFVGSGLLVPVGGLMVRRWGVVTGGRIMYLMGGLLISTALFIRQRYVQESSQGQDRVEAAINSSPQQIWGEFALALRLLKESPVILILFLVQTLAMFTAAIRNTYSSLFMTDSLGLGLSPSIIALIPAATSATMIAVLITLMPRLGPQHSAWGLSIGALAFTAGSLCLLVAPPQVMVFPVISGICLGFGAAVLEPIRQACMANAIPDRYRAKLNSVIAVFTLIALIPAGPLAGLLYKINPRLPFVVITVLHLVMQVLIAGLTRTWKKLTRMEV